MLTSRLGILISGALLMAAACGGESTAGGDAADAGPDAAAGTAGVGGSAATGGGGSGGAATGGAGATTTGGMAGAATGGMAGAAGGSGGAAPVGRCADTPPAGATLAAAPKAYSGGTCPTLTTTTGTNQIQSSGIAREFILVVPANLDPNEKLPVIFLWHWLGGSASSFLREGEVQAAVDTQRFIAVIPESRDLNLWKWPYAISDGQAAMDVELAFFDDMLACVSEQFNVNKECVSTAGASAGALWSAQLASYRDEYLASFMSLSGGVGGTVIKPWGNPAHKMPAFVLWGGPTDQCFYVLNLEQTSKELESELVADNHFFVECVHNCGHGVPPFEGPAGYSKFKALWDFAFDHPFWLEPGQSPYNASGLPAELPDWCGIGAGSAVPRTGACPDPPGC